MMRLKSVIRLALSMAICLGVGIVESFVTRPEIPTWYAGLAKPSWTPPPLVFPIAWTALYILMAVSFWRLGEHERSEARSSAMTWFIAQLAINAAWSPVFFGWHGTAAALVICHHAPVGPRGQASWSGGLEIKAGMTATAAGPSWAQPA